MLLLKICQSAWSKVSIFGAGQQYGIRSKLASVCRLRCNQPYRLFRQQYLVNVPHRLFGKMPRLPLDAENLSAVVTKDITIFTYKNDRFFKMLTIFGGLQFMFWANFAHFIYFDPTVKSRKSDAQKNDSSWMGRFYNQYRTKMAVATFCLGCLVLFYTLNYPMRTVSQLTLLKGAKQVGVTTYSHFGRTRQLTVPLEDVSCRRSRASSHTQTAMKIRGYYMYFLLDMRDGRFHEPKLFDYVIGLNRSLK